MDDAQELVKEFLVESYENLDQLDRDLVTLEQDPASHPTLSSIFRTIHTIKGTCGFLGFGKLESVAHVGENLLSKLRDGQLELHSEMTTGLLSLVDAIREILGSIETAGAEGDADYQRLIQTLVALQEEQLPDSHGQDSDGAVVCATPASPPVSLPVAVEIPADSLCSTPETTAIAPDEIKSEAIEAAGSTGEGRHGSVVDSSIRVDVGLLDKLMNRVGELVLARNQILQFTSTLGDSALLETSQRLNLITTELQEGVMKTRMQPIGNIWAKFPRVVRDLSAQLGKQVRIEMEGKETELDKTIVEAIKDPLTHLVRNSVDHGIESQTSAVLLARLRLQTTYGEDDCLLGTAVVQGRVTDVLNLRKLARYESR